MRSSAATSSRSASVPFSAREAVDGLLAMAALDAGAREQRVVDRLAARQRRRARRSQPIEHERQAGGIVRRTRRRRLRSERRLPHRLERRHRRVEHVVQVVVHRLAQDLERGLGGLARSARSSARAPLRAARAAPDRSPCAAGSPGASSTRSNQCCSDANRGRAGAEVLRLEQPLQQRRLDDVVVLVHPERFEQVVLVVGVVRRRGRRPTCAAPPTTSSVGRSRSARRTR